MKESVSKLTD